jgi:hypothetical protein
LCQRLKVSSWRQLKLFVETFQIPGQAALGSIYTNRDFRVAPCCMMWHNKIGTDLTVCWSVSRDTEQHKNQ